MSVQFDIRVITGNSNAAIDGIVTGMHSATGATNGLESAIAKIGNTAFHLNNIQTAISGIANDFENAVQPGIAFDDNLKDLQAITNVTDAQLQKIGASARQQAKDFGIDASGGLNSYKLLLSKLGPELANNDVALAGLGKNAAILSKQMGNDVQGATELIATAMNQFGISIKDPNEAMRISGVMMNIMSAAAQEGSAEMPQIKAALEQSGMVARMANVSFTELNASIQVLDKAGKKGAEGGVAIRNVLTELGQGALMPRRALGVLEAAGISVEGLGDKSKSFSQRLGLLKPLVNDTAAMTALFGKENVAAGIALIQNTSEIDRLTGKITNTHSATDMAKIKMKSFAEQMNRTHAAIADFGIGLFNSTKPFIPFIHFGMSSLSVMANMAQASNLFSIIGKTKLIATLGTAAVATGSWIMTTVGAIAAQLGLNAAMEANPIGFVVVAVVAAIAAVSALIYYWDEIWGAIKSFTVWMYEHSPFKFLVDAVEVLFPGFKAAMGHLWDWIVGKFEALMGWIKKVWGGIKALFVGGDLKDASKGAVEDLVKQIKEVPGITVQGVADNKSPIAGYDPHAKKKHDKTAQEMSSNISSGGTKNTVVHLTVQKLVGIGEMKTLNILGGAKEAGNRVVEEILMALQSVNGKVSTE